ncbi:MAG: hypothetical protein [Caudoviricetes sp.]|nr:MAG: hypothetical protein [Caudoviricetes sp.]
MASLIKIGAEFKEALPSISHDGEWIPCIPWVFNSGVWKRTYDPGFVNLINNSRLLNGTDITIKNGQIDGTAPVDWTVGTMSTGNSYSYSSATSKDMVRSYRFVSDASRHYYVTRAYVQAGYVYSASAFVEDIKVKNEAKVLQIYEEDAAITITKDFVPSKNMTVGRQEMMFEVRKSGVVQLRIGGGVDMKSDADVTISRPQITRGNFSVDWQPTPIVAPYYGINFINSYLYPPVLIVQDKQGEFSFDATVRIDSLTSEFVLFGRTDNNQFTGLSLGLNHLYVYRDDVIDKRVELIKPIVRDNLVGIKVIWRKTGNYLSDIRLYQNGELLGRIPTTLYSGNIDSFIGSPNRKTGGVTLQAFSMKTSKLYGFNVDEGKGNVIRDRNNQVKLTIDGTENNDFMWVSKMGSPVITVDAVSQSGRVGEEVRFFADATMWTSVQWFKDNKAIPGATSIEYVIKSIKESDFGLYWCVFSNEYASVSTSRVRLKLPDDNRIILCTEDNKLLTLEDGKTLLLTEDI